MAPRAPNQKRKRGQAVVASTAPESASSREPKRVSSKKRQLDVQNEETNATGAQMLEKKKRGRPRKSLDPLPEAPAVAESSKPKKRERRAQDQEVEEGEDVDTENARPRKRAKPSGAEWAAQEPLADRAKVPSNEGTEESSVRRSRRDRRSADDNPWWTAQPGETSSQAQESEKTKRPRQPEKPAASSTADEPRKGRQGRSANNTGKGKEPQTQLEEIEARPAKQSSRPAKTQAPEAPETSGVRRSTRDRRSADDNPWWSSQPGESPSQPAQQEKEAGRSSKGRPSRPSLGEVPVSEAQNKPAQGRSKQTSKSSASKPSLEQSTSRTQLVKRNSGPRTSGAASDIEVTQRRKASSPTRRRSSQGVESDPLAKHRHLTSRTRQIPRATIASKWVPLDGPSIEAIGLLLTTASNKVLSRLRDRDSRYEQAQNILHIFSKRLHNKLVKGMPFPPPSTGNTGKASTSHESEFDYERTVDAIETAQKALDPLRHSVALLKAEKEREEELLERDFALLKQLESNARAEKRRWKEGSKREHVLAPTPIIKDEDRDVKVGVVASGIFKDLEDEGLVALSQQVGNHMESMQGNLLPIEGVLPAIVKSRAALQGVLCRHLDPEQYDQVILG
ncbi:hypothetical protein OQA88_11356 [Cercophora sp. LCS_1]